MSVRTLLLRGMFAGLVGGLVVFGFLKVLGEEQVGRAISFEKSTAVTAAATVPAVDSTPPSDPATTSLAMGHETEAVSRNVQSTVGLGTGTIVIGVALGGIFALAFAVAHGRIGARRQRATALMVALLGFVAVHLVPFLKYPANPPAIGDPDSLGRRTALFFATLAS